MLIVQVEDFGLQERSFLIQLYDLEAGAALGDDIHAPVGIFLGDCQYFCGAANLSELLLLASEDAEVLAAVEAFGNHFAIARLENVQWQRRARKQNQVQWK